MLAQRLRRWANIKPALFAWMDVVAYQDEVMACTVYVRDPISLLLNRIRDRLMSLGCEAIQPNTTTVVLTGLHHSLHIPGPVLVLFSACSRPIKASRTLCYGIQHPAKPNKSHLTGRLSAAL